MCGIKRKMESAILVDARELKQGRLTGIGRVVVGLVDALEDSAVVDRIVLALSADGSLPSVLQGRSRIDTVFLPASLLRSEKRLADLTRKAKLFISPYPKLPLWGCHCPCINMVHDVFDLTHPLYRRRMRTRYDRWRLVRGLRRADLTWFVSQYSLDETIKEVGFSGNRPEIRYSGVEALFNARHDPQDVHILAGLNLEPGYIIAIGNGKPHKNLGVVLACAAKSRREIVFVGVPARNRQYWHDSNTGSRIRWLDFVPDQALPALLRQAFCLAQPSTAEGYGYPPLEAMACGTPAVVSDIPVLVETTGGHALAVDPYSPDEWGRAFLELEDESSYRRQVASGLEWTSSLKGRPAWSAHIEDIRHVIGDR